VIIFYLQNGHSFILLMLNATNREPERPTAGAHIGIAATEEEVAGIRTTHRTAPTVAAGPNTGERTSAAVADARHGQFKRRGKRPCTIITAPT